MALYNQTHTHTKKKNRDEQKKNKMKQRIDTHMKIKLFNKGVLIVV